MVPQDNSHAPASSSTAPPIVVPKHIANDTSKPITALAKHRLREGGEELFEQWIKEMADVQSNVEGYLGSEVIHPYYNNQDYKTREYISIFRYDSYEHLKRWMESDLRAKYIEKAKEFSELPLLVTYHSLEHWFVQNADKDNDDFSVASSSSERSNSNNNKKGAPPAKYKMVVVVFLVIWFQVHYVVPQTVGRIKELPPLAQESLGTLLITMLTTYVFMPISTRLLAFWLFPGCDYCSTLKELIPSPLTELIRRVMVSSRGSSRQHESSFRPNPHEPSQITTQSSGDVGDV